MFSFIQKKKPCHTIEYNHTQPKYFDWLLKRHIAGIKQALVIDWLNLFSQQLATVSASLNKRNLDFSSWDSFFCPLSTMHRVNFYSLIYLSEQAPTKVLGNLTCISITPEWLSRDKSWHTMQKHRYCSCPLFLNSFFFFFLLFFLLSSSPSRKQSISPLVNTASTLKGFEQFHKSHPTFQKFWFFVWSFKKVRRIFFPLLMKLWQRDFWRKLFSLMPLRSV